MRKNHLALKRFQHPSSPHSSFRIFICRPHRIPDRRGIKKHPRSLTSPNGWQQDCHCACSLVADHSAHDRMSLQLRDERTGAVICFVPRQSAKGVAAQRDSPQSVRSAGANSAIRRRGRTQDPRSVACFGPEKQMPYSGARQGSRCTGNALELLFMHHWEKCDSDKNSKWLLW